MRMRACVRVMIVSWHAGFYPSAAASCAAAAMASVSDWSASSQLPIDWKRPDGCWLSMSPRRTCTATTSGRGAVEAAEEAADEVAEAVGPLLAAKGVSKRNERAYAPPLPLLPNPLELAFPVALLPLAAGWYQGRCLAGLGARS